MKIIHLITFAVTLAGASYGAFKQSQLEGEVIFVRDSGFFPSKISRPAGKFVLIVINRSRKSQLAVGLKRSDGVVSISAVPSTDSDQSFVIDLPVGQHVLSDATQTNWPGVAITIK